MPVVVFVGDAPEVSCRGLRWVKDRAAVGEAQGSARTRRGRGGGRAGRVYSGELPRDEPLSLERVGRPLSAHRSTARSPIPVHGGVDTRHTQTGTRTRTRSAGACARGSG